MRVLHICSGNLFGGVETLLLSLARGGSTGENHFALCFDGVLQQELQRIGAPVHSLGEVRTRNPLSVLLGRRKLEGVLKAGGFDAAVCHLPWSLAVFGPVVKRQGVPLAFWVHAAFEDKGWLDRAACAVDPDMLLCVSDFTALLAEKHFPEVPRRVCHPPVPAWRFAAADGGPIRAELGTRPTDRVFLQVSRMEPGKGHSIFLEALGRMAAVPGWEAWIVGGAQRRSEIAYFESLQRQVSESGIQHRVRFLGERPDVNRLLAGADVFCHPNTVPEGFGIACLEALYAGLPIVASNSGGTRELLNDSCAILTPPNDSVAVEYALLRLLNDAGLLQALGSGGRGRSLKISDPQQAFGEIRKALVALSSRESAWFKMRSPTSVLRPQQ